MIKIFTLEAVLFSYTYCMYLKFRILTKSVVNNSWILYEL